MDKKNMDELEEWINAYDEPIDRTCVADIFYEFKSEVEELEKALDKEVHMSFDIEGQLHEANDKIKELEEELKLWRLEGMI